MRQPLTAIALAAFVALPHAASAQESDDAGNVTVVQEADEGATVIINGKVVEESTITDEMMGEDEVTAQEAAAKAKDEEPNVTIEQIEFPEGTPVEGQVLRQSPNTVLVTSILGSDVRDRNGDTIGEIENLLFAADGSVSALVFSVGGFLGIGDRNVALDYSRLRIEQEEDGEFVYIVDADEDELEEAPKFLTSDDIEELEEEAAERAEEAAEEAAEQAAQ